MSTPAGPGKPRGLALILGWRRVRFVLFFSLAWSLLLALAGNSGWTSILARTLWLGFTALLVFGVFEQWPRRLPRWLARWVLQVVSVAFIIPPALALSFALTTARGEPPFYHVPGRMRGFSMLAGLGVFVAPWVALAALVRQKEALARHQALAFDLERSQLERQALDARLNLLQAQVAPHFLFNTLANVPALIAAGSPRASAVLRRFPA